MRDVKDGEVTELNLVFDWMDPGDYKKTMLHSGKREDDFIYLLEQIDECSCWESDTKKCLLAIDVFTK